MIRCRNPLRTIEDARQHRYAVWVGNPAGNKYVEGRCAMGVHERAVFPQCLRPAGHGPGNLYCKQHARMIEAADPGE